MTGRRSFLRGVSSLSGVSVASMFGLDSVFGSGFQGRFCRYAFSVDPSEWGSVDSVMMYYTMDERTLVESFKFTVQFDLVAADESLVGYHNGGSLRHRVSDVDGYMFESELRVENFDGLAEYDTGSELSVFMYVEDLFGDEDRKSINLTELPDSGVDPVEMVRRDRVEQARVLLNSIPSVQTGLFRGMRFVSESERYFDFELSRSIEEVIDGELATFYYTADPLSLFRLYRTTTNFQVKSGELLGTSFYLSHTPSDHPEYDYQAVRRGVFYGDIEYAASNVHLRLSENPWSEFISGVKQLGEGNKRYYTLDGTAIQQGEIQDEWV